MSFTLLRENLLGKVQTEQFITRRKRTEKCYSLDRMQMLKTALENTIYSVLDDKIVQQDALKLNEIISNTQRSSA